MGGACFISVPHVPATRGYEVSGGVAARVLSARNDVECVFLTPEVSDDLRVP